jgi:hypothetical protein
MASMEGPHIVITRRDLKPKAAQTDVALVATANANVRRATKKRRLANLTVEQDELRSRMAARRQRLQGALE